MEKLTRPRRVLYANGHLGFSILDNIYGAYLLFFLIPPDELGMPQLVDNRPLLLGITIVGLINIFGRVVDSVADPLIAWWSDNARYRVGRRRFFLLTGAVPFAVSAVLLFTPPDAGVSTLNAVYVSLMLGLFFFMYTYYMAPNLALIPELSRTVAERISITVAQAAFTIGGAGVVLLGFPLVWGGLQAGGMETGGAFRMTVAILAGLAGVSMLVSGLAVDEKRFARGGTAQIGLFESIRRTVVNPYFIVYITGTILYWFGFNMIRAVIAYYPIVLLGMSPDFQSILMATLFGTAIIVFLLLPALSRRFTHKQLMLAGMLSFSALMSLTVVIRLFGSFALPAALVQMGLMGFPVAILLVIPNAAIADLSELDGRKTGQNREAMFFGAQGLFMKVNYGIAIAITAGLLGFFGRDAANPRGVELVGPVGAAFVLVGFFIFLRYPQKKILHELETLRAED